MTDHTQAQALLLCPFCGGKAKISRESLDERYGYADKVKVQCTACGVAVSAVGDTSKPGYADNSTVEKRATDAWNRRSIPQGEEPAKGAAQGDELPPLPVPVAALTDKGRAVKWSAIYRTEPVFKGYQPLFTGEQYRQGQREYVAACRAGEKADARDAALEEAAKVCEGIEGDRFDAYKGRGKWEAFNPGRADPYVNGESDGAGQCAISIRKLKSGDAARSHTGKEGDG